MFMSTENLRSMIEIDCVLGQDIIEKSIDFGIVAFSLFDKMLNFREKLLIVSE